MNRAWHQFCDFLRLVGMRDRMRCPRCRAVGTWKPHGGWLDFDDERPVRRWMCKWCGHYVGPEGVQQVELGEYAWVMQSSKLIPPDTPQRRSYPANPWAG